MRVVVIFEFDEISNPDSEEATVVVEAIAQDCETMQTAFNASGCWIPWQWFRTTAQPHACVPSRPWAKCGGL